MNGLLSLLLGTGIKPNRTPTNFLECVRFKSFKIGCVQYGYPATRTPIDVHKKRFLPMMHEHGTVTLRIFIHQANRVDNNKQYKQIKSNNYSTDKKTLEAHLKCRYAFGP